MMMRVLPPARFLGFWYPPTGRASSYAHCATARATKRPSVVSYQTTAPSIWPPEN